MNSVSEKDRNRLQLTHLMYVAHVFDEVAWENSPDNSLICLNVAYAFG